MSQTPLYIFHFSQCSDKDYLPNVAKANMKPEEWQRMRTSASVVKERLEQSKVKRQENLESISNQMSVILSKIREKRDAINQRLDAAEDDIKGKLDSKFIEFSGALTKEIERLDEFIKIIDGYEDGKTENKSDNYIMLKQMKQKLADENRFAASLSPPNNSIDYIETSDMAEIIGVVDKFSFGYISGNGGVETVTEEADINIKSTGDTTVSCICDSCLMESGEVILTDQNNRNIKKLDCSFHLKVSLALPGKPCAVCPTDGSEIAVSLLNTKTIHFVSTGSPMFLLSNKIKIGESCRGIAYNEGKLYLSCGGMTKYHDGPGQIRVYEKSGQFLRNVDNVVKIPKRMTICKDKHPADIYIADEENGVLCLDTSVPSDSITSAFDYQQLVGAVGVCYLGRGQIAVCGYDSHNVLLVSKSGNLIKELRSRNHGIVKPKTICLDHTGHKMLVGLTDNDHIKVINLIRS